MSTKIKRQAVFLPRRQLLRCALAGAGACLLPACGGGSPGSDTAAPSVPVGLAASAISATQINLTWAASTDDTAVIGYRIYRDGTQIATPATNSYSDTGLTASTAYAYRLAAYDAAGNVSAQCTAANVTTSAGIVVLSTTEFPIDVSAVIADKDHPSAGNDLTTLGRGDADTPFLSIQHALCSMKISGKRTLYIKPSVQPYFEPYRMRGSDIGGITVAPDISGTAVTPLVISGYPGMVMPMIDQQQAFAAYQVATNYSTTDLPDINIGTMNLSGFLVKADYVVIRGLEIRNTSGSGVYFNPYGDTFYGLVEYNHIHHCYGIALQKDNIASVRLDHAQYTTVRENIFHDNYKKDVPGTNPINAEPYLMHSGIHGFRPSNCEIYNNEIYNVGKAIYMKQPDENRLPGHRMHNNYLHDLAETGFMVGTMGAEMPSNNGNWFFQNIVARAYGTAVITNTNSYSTDQPQKVYIYNNTFVQCKIIMTMKNELNVEVYNNVYSNHVNAYEIYSVDERRDETYPWNTHIDYFDYNLYDAPGRTFFTVNREAADEHSFTTLAQWQTAFSGGIASDIMDVDPDAHSSTGVPVFVDAANDDYRLQVGSPGYQQGKSRDGLTTVNMGAYVTGTEKIGPSWNLVSGAAKPA